MDLQSNDRSYLELSVICGFPNNSRFDPSKDDVAKSHLGKKDRDRDTTLAMLAPDVISTDPQVLTNSSMNNKNLWITS